MIICRTDVKTGEIICGINGTISAIQEADIIAEECTANAKILQHIAEFDGRIKVIRFFKFYIFALAIASLWCAMPYDSHASTKHACSCSGCANGVCKIGCPHTDDAAHSPEYLNVDEGGIGSTDTCACTSCPLPISENAVAVIEQYENIKKAAVCAFHAAAGPTTYARCGAFTKAQILPIPAVRQLYILHASFLL